MSDNPESDAPASSEAAAEPAGDAPVAQFDDLKESAPRTPTEEPAEVDLERILDVPVTLALEVGKKQLTIGDLLRLNQGSVVELDREADQPMDVLVNGTLVAHAEIVIVDDMYGIRLTDVVSPRERIRQLH